MDLGVHDWGSFGVQGMYPSAPASRVWHRPAEESMPALPRTQCMFGVSIRLTPDALRLGDSVLSCRTKRKGLRLQGFRIRKL